MHPLMQNYLDETEVAGNAEQFRLALSRFAAALELPAFAYIAIPSTAGRQLRLITNYAETWRQHYVDHRYETCDPIVLHSIRHRHSFDWGREFGGNDPFCLRFFDEAASFGIRYGYTIPVHHWHGRFAALTFATDREPLAFLRSPVNSIGTCTISLVPISRSRGSISPAASVNVLHCRRRAKHLAILASC